MKNIKSSKKNNKKINNIVYLNKKNKNKESIQVVLVISISLFLFLLSLAGSLVKINLKSKVPTIVIVNGSIDTSENVKGVIVRKENVYKTEIKGKVNYVISENEKIKKGQVILNIEDKNIVDNLKLKEKNINKTIFNIQEQRENISAFSQDINNINNKIKYIIDNNIYKFTKSDMKSVYFIKNNIDSNINYKNNILLNEDRGLPKEYIEENIKIQKEISKNTYEIKANEGGILSYKIDGFENIFNFDSMLSLSKEQTNIVVNNNIENFNIVNEKLPVFKIIESNKWYICAYIPNKFIKTWEENNEIEIYIEEENNLKQLNMNIYKIIPGKKDSYVIFESRKKMLDYIDKRSVNFKICNNIFSGLKLPKSSITEKNFLKLPKSFVYEDKLGKVIYKQCNTNTEKIYIDIKYIKNNEENYVYIIEDNNKIYLEDIIINKKGEKYKIEEEKNKKGVFKVNNGIANFVPIDEKDIIYGEKDYIIISENNSFNLNLNIYDRIISDIENYNIVEGQKIT